MPFSPQAGLVFISEKRVNHLVPIIRQLPQSLGSHPPHQLINKRLPTSRCGEFTTTYNLWDLPTKSSNNPKTAGFLGTPRAFFRGTPCKNERGFLTYGYLSNLKLVRSSSITHHTHWHYNQLSEVQTAKSSFMFWICGKNWGLIGHSETINDHVSSGLKNLCKNRRAQMISKQKIATAKCTFNETLGFTAGDHCQLLWDMEKTVGARLESEDLDTNINQLLQC